MTKRARELQAQALAEYMELFVQPFPRYVTKSHGGTWRSIKRKLGESQVLEHLKGIRSIATLGRYYPQFAIVDIDGRSLAQVERIRAGLGLDQGNSMLCASESPDHYHILLSPVFGGKPPTLRLLAESLGPAVLQLGVELYPQREKCIRLPFGPSQPCLDPGFELCDWFELLYRFKKLELYDLGAVRRLPLFKTALLAPRASGFSGRKTAGSILEEGTELLFRGLATPSSRNQSQFKVLYALWRNGSPLEDAINACRQWIRDKHNGMSKDIGAHRLQRIDREIAAQARRIWSSYSAPLDRRDRIRLICEGWITQDDVLDILVICRGKRSLSRFLYELVKFAYPRREQQGGFMCHSSKLEAFSSSSSYLDHVATLERQGILHRRSEYIVGGESKRVMLFWNFRQTETPLLDGSQSPARIDDAMLLISARIDMIAILERRGLARRDLPRIKSWLAALREGAAVAFDAM